MNTQINLQIGDVSDNGQVTILDEDKLSYLVESNSRGAVGIRTISKNLLREYINYLLSHPNATPDEIRGALSGTSDIDKFEYGYTSTLTTMAKMSIANQHRKNPSSNKLSALYPLQQIFYGAPGTGKSHETNRVTREYRDTIRTTFHPDSDYSTFVGAYKPTTTEEKMYGLDSQGNTVQYVFGGKPLETTKIVYKFVKQAFLKAYILAWKKMCVEDTPLVGPLTFTNKAIYTIKEVDETKVTYQKEHSFPKKLVESEWNKIWSKGSFVIPTGKQSGKSIQHAIIQWIYNLKGSETTSNDFEAGWSKLIGDLKTSKKIEVKKTKVYTLTYNSDEEYVNVQSQANAKRPTIQKCYEGKNHRDSVEGIAEVLRAYNLSTFEEAWIRLTEDVKKGVETNINVDNTIAEQFLVIEEINRGNCAQIFGDIFQLLDRTDNGYSQYPIEADEDIKKALLEDDPADGLSFGGEGLKLSDGIIDELNEVFNESSDDIVSKICMGDVLVLPKNLHIWATMNTSDQSLFPIDSAFKRRWDWTYMPIKEAKDKNYKIVLSDSNIEYKWWDFISALNNVINDVTNSEDKKLGYFFCKPCDDKNITASQFVNKVIFYLWNDVLKDYEMPKEFEYGDIKKKEDNSKSNHMSFNDFYTDQEKCIRQLMENLGVKPIAEVVKTEPTTDDASTAATSEPATDDATASTAAIGTDESTKQTLF